MVIPLTKGWCFLSVSWNKLLKKNNDKNSRVAGNLIRLTACVASLLWYLQIAVSHLRHKWHHVISTLQSPAAGTGSTDRQQYPLDTGGQLFCPSLWPKVSNTPHYIDVIMITVASQNTNLMVIYWIVYSGADQRKHQSSASLAFVRGNHRDRWIPRTKGQ